VKTLVGLLCYLALLLAALLGCHSTSGVVLLGVAPVLLLDRLVFRLLPWPSPPQRGREVANCISWFVVGVVGLLLLWPAPLAWREYIFLAAELSLAAFLLETAVELAAQLLPRPFRARAGSNQTMLARLRAAALVVLLLLLLSPLGALHPPHVSPQRTPAELGFAFETVQVTTTDNVALQGWLVPHAEARANVVFCHGHHANRGEVIGFLKTLHELRVNVLACDFRGHGDSPGHTVTFGQRETRDVAAAVDYLRHRFPGKPLLIIGVSYGAAVTLQALPDLGDVRAVWVEAAFARLNSPVEHFFKFVPEAVRPGVVDFYNALGWVDCGFWGGDINPVDRLAEVKVPICFCHGRADDRIPFADGQALYDAYRGPKRCFWVEDGTHDDLRTRHEEVYFKRLQLFFEEHLSKPLAA
jgi:alpha-beta hydrolase superfamily lysophospholipase